MLFRSEKGDSTLQNLSKRQAAWVSELAEDLPLVNIRIGVGMIRGLINRLEAAD